MNIPNCPVCGTKPEVYLYPIPSIDRYYTKIFCVNRGCRIKPAFRLDTPGGCPVDLSDAFDKWEYRARKLGEKNGVKL